MATDRLSPSARSPVAATALLALAALSSPAAAQDAFVVSPGPAVANPDRVRVFDEAGNPTAVDFFPYGSGAWGVNVAAGQLDAAALDEILTGPGPGPGLAPHVRGYFRDGTPIAKINFFASAMTHGTNVAAGDVDDDGFHEILTGAGPGPFGPQVRGWNYDGAGVAVMVRINVYAYVTTTFGVTLAAGDVQGSSHDDVITAPGPGPGFAPEVRVFDATFLYLKARSVRFTAFYGPELGARVGAGDVDAAGNEDILVATGPDPAFPTDVLGFDTTSAVAPLPGFDTYGGDVAAGSLAGNTRDDLFVGEGNLPASSTLVRGMRYNGATLTQVVSFTAFPGLSYGVRLAAGELGY